MKPSKSKQNRVAHVYLAGPDVFYPNAMEIGTRKKAILKEMGLEGHFPIDGEIDFRGKALENVALEIGALNERMVRDCDIIIANMEPWRGPSMDVGTAYESGYGRALGKIVVGYTPDQRPFSERLRAFLTAQLPLHPEWSKTFEIKDGRTYGPDGKSIESFGQMADNLMMVNAVVASGGSFKLPATFEEAARLAKTLWEQKIKTPKWKEEIRRI